MQILLVVNSFATSVTPRNTVQVHQYLARHHDVQVAVAGVAEDVADGLVGVHRLLREHAEREKQYDRDTRHGASQGARLE